MYQKKGSFRVSLECYRHIFKKFVSQIDGIERREIDDDGLRLERGRGEGRIELNFFTMMVEVEAEHFLVLVPLVPDQSRPFHPSPKDCPPPRPVQLLRTTLRHGHYPKRVQVVVVVVVVMVVAALVTFLLAYCRRC
jgi:hypothetical protein